MIPFCLTQSATYSPTYSTHPLPYVRVQGELRLELKYTPLRGEAGQPLRPLQPVADEEKRGAAATAQGAQDAQEGAEWRATLASGLAKGGSEGVDWSTLARRVGTVGTDDNAQCAPHAAPRCSLLSPPPHYRTPRCSLLSPPSPSLASTAPPPLPHRHLHRTSTSTAPPRKTPLLCR